MDVRGYGSGGPHGLSSGLIPYTSGKNADWRSLLRRWTVPKLTLSIGACVKYSQQALVRAGLPYSFAVNE